MPFSQMQGAYSLNLLVFLAAGFRKENMTAYETTAVELHMTLPVTFCEVANHPMFTRQADRSGVDFLIQHPRHIDYCPI